MPLSTFKNLARARQREIIEVALREFTMHDYQSASLSRIIKTLGLAKGSFYRYFSSKKELYFYLLEEVTAARYLTLETRMKEHIDFFELVRINWYDKIRFEQENPLESGFLYRVMRERYNPEIGNLELDLKRSIMGTVKQMLTTHYSHSIRKDLDIDFITFTIVQIQLGFYDFLAIKHNDDLMENLNMGEPIYALQDEAIEKIISAFTSLLKEGITNKREK